MDSSGTGTGEEEQAPLNAASLIVPNVLPYQGGTSSSGTGTTRSTKSWSEYAFCWKWSSFQSVELESLYRRYVFRLRLGALVSQLVLVAVLTAVLAAVNLAFTTSATVINVVFVILCILCVLSIVYVHTPYMTVGQLPFVSSVALVIMCCLGATSLPIAFGDRPSTLLFTPVDGVWEVCVAVFLIYGLQSLHIGLTAVAGVLLPVSHILVTTLFAEGYTHEYSLKHQIIPPDYLTPLWKQVRLRD